MKAINVRWHVVLITVLVIVALSAASIITGALGPISKSLRCRAMLDRISVLMRDREELCKEAKINEKTIEDALENDPASGLARYCGEVLPGLFVIGRGRNGKRPGIIDAWGNRVIVQMWGKRSNGKSAAPYLRFGKHWIRVWSVGANGIDERGEGDDLVMNGNYIGAECFALMPGDDASRFLELTRAEGGVDHVVRTLEEGL